VLDVVRAVERGFPRPPKRTGSPLDPFLAWLNAEVAEAVSAALAKRTLADYLAGEPAGGRHRPRTAPALTVEDILAWAERHRRQTGRWPTAESGPVADSPGLTWGNVHQCLRVGWRGLPGGTTLSQLLAPLKAADRPPAPDPGPSAPAGPVLTVESVLAWADAWKARTGRWPKPQDGPVPERPGLKWRAVHDALRHGRYGLPGGSSLPLLLRDRRGRRHKHEQPR
jgi:hypothetical protein